MFFILLILGLIGLGIWKFGMSNSATPSETVDQPNGGYVNPNAANTSVQVLPAPASL